MYKIKFGYVEKDTYKSRVKTVSIELPPATDTPALCKLLLATVDGIKIRWIDKPLEV